MVDHLSVNLRRFRNFRKIYVRLLTLIESYPQGLNHLGHSKRGLRILLTLEVVEKSIYFLEQNLELGVRPMDPKPCFLLGIISSPSYWLVADFMVIGLLRALGLDLGFLHQVSDAAMRL